MNLHFHFPLTSHPVIMKVFQEFSTKTSLHGIHFLGDTKSRLLEKIFWILVFISSLTILIKFSIDLRYPSYMTFQVHNLIDVKVRTSVLRAQRLSWRRVTPSCRTSYSPEWQSAVLTKSGRVSSNGSARVSRRLDITFWTKRSTI